MPSNVKISSLIDKAIFDYSMIEDGDRIIIGASGGKDSTLLVEYFSNRAKRKNCNFSYKAVAIQNDFAPPFPEKIISLFNTWNVPFEIISVDVLGRLKENKKMNCWWCSTQRRSELLNYAIKNNFNKIALGHHLDDILETLLMNMLNKAELSTMSPKLKYKNYPVTILRPLCYIGVDKIIEYASVNNWRQYTCTCDYQDNSERKNARELLKNLTDEDSSKKMHIFNSLKNIQKEYLP